METLMNTQSQVQIKLISRIKIATLLSGDVRVFGWPNDAVTFISPHYFPFIFILLNKGDSRADITL